MSASFSFRLRSKSPSALEQLVAERLRQYFAAHTDRLPPPGLYARFLPLVERPLIEITLCATGGNQLKAARTLGINRNTLRKKVQELGIDVDSLTADPLRCPPPG